MFKRFLKKHSGKCIVNTGIFRDAFRRAILKPGYQCWYQIKISGNAKLRFHFPIGFQKCKTDTLISILKTMKYITRIVGAMLLLLGSKSALHAQSKLNIHGYFSQAYAKSSHYQVYGIPKSGSSDIRSLALQFRYDASAQNTMIIQFNHRRSGNSPIMAENSSLSLDWAFFEHRFANNISLKIGKILLPYGLFNELRDVGVLLPFYQAPSVVYTEGKNIGETIDGISFSYTFDRFLPWVFDIHLSGGHWEWLEWQKMAIPNTDMIVEVVETAHIERAVGTQLVLHTPVDGVRLAFGGYSGKITGGINFTKDRYGEQHFLSLSGSIEGEFDRVFAHTEFSRFSTNEMAMVSNAYYVQAGYKLFGKTWIQLQSQFLNLNDLPVPAPLIPMVQATAKDIEITRDNAIGIRYFISSNFVFKTELHWYQGLGLEDQLVNIFVDSAYKTRFFILSVATSF